MIYENKLLREMALYFYQVRMKFKDDSKIKKKILVNSIPKSGTHLLTALLTEFDGVHNSGVHIKTYEVNELNKGGADGNVNFRLNKNKFLKKVKGVNGGQIISSHLPYDDQFTDCFDDEEFCVLFMKRNPRDILFSEYYYIKNLQRHFMYDWLSSFDSKDSALVALINGNDSGFPSFNERLSRFSGWQSLECCKTLSFENTVCIKDGGDVNAARNIIGEISGLLNLQMKDLEIEKILLSMKEKGSFTMRAGKANGWLAEYESISNETKDIIEKGMGSLDKAYGY